MLLKPINQLVRSYDWHLTTAEINYFMPDHPHLIQTFIWQKHDLSPDFPALNKFLDFWRKEIEGALHSVRVASSALIRPADFRYSNGNFLLN